MTMIIITAAMLEEERAIREPLSLSSLVLQESSFGVHSTVSKSSWKVTLLRVVRISLEELLKYKKQYQGNSTTKDLNS
jgi:hypothetical protein